MITKHLKKLVVFSLCALAALSAAAFAACSGETACTHEWDSGVVTTAATCTSEGVKTYTCNLCKTTKTEVIEKTAHDYSGSWQSSADGHYHVCTVCGEATDEVTAHTYVDGEVLQAATETEEGVMSVTCSVCGYESTRAIATLNHTAAEVWTYDENTHWNACADHGDCGAVFNKSAHVWGEGTVVTAATCATEGVMSYSCTVCGATKTETIEKTTHDYSGSWQSSSAGHYHVCTTCNDAIDEVVAHTYVDGDVITEPTAEQDGVRKIYCSVCGYESTKAIPATSHTAADTWTYDDNNHWHACAAHSNCETVFDSAAHTLAYVSDGDNGHHQVCSVCGYATSISEHTWNDGEVTTSPTLYSAGVKTYTCTACGATKTETLAAAADFADDFTTASDQSGAWKYGSVEYNFSDETFTFTQATELNSGSDGWTANNVEIKAGWISAGAMLGISYTVTQDITVLVNVNVNGSQDGSRLNLRIGVISKDGTLYSTPSFHNNENGNSYSVSNYYELNEGDTIYFMLDDGGSDTNNGSYPQASLSINLKPIEQAADFASEFTTASDQSGAWKYGAISYSWDASNKLTYSGDSIGESFTFTQATELNGGSDGWTADNVEIKAGWISAGAMLGISYTVTQDTTVLVNVNVNGSQDGTRLDLRIAVVSKDGTLYFAPSFHNNSDGNSYSATQYYELNEGDTIYFILGNGGTLEGSNPQADLSITVYEAVADPAAGTEA